MVAKIYCEARRHADESSISWELGAYPEVLRVTGWERLWLNNVQVTFDRAVGEVAGRSGPAQGRCPTGGVVSGRDYLAGNGGSHTCRAPAAGRRGRLAAAWRD